MTYPRSQHEGSQIPADQPAPQQFGGGTPDASGIMPTTNGAKQIGVTADGKPVYEHPSS